MFLRRLFITIIALLLIIAPALPTARFSPQISEAEAASPEDAWTYSINSYGGAYIYNKPKKMSFVYSGGSSTDSLYWYVKQDTAANKEFSDIPIVSAETTDTKQTRMIDGVKYVEELVPLTDLQMQVKMTVTNTSAVPHTIRLSPYMDIKMGVDSKYEDYVPLEYLPFNSGILAQWLEKDAQFQILFNDSYAGATNIESFKGGSYSGYNSNPNDPSLVKYDNDPSYSTAYTGDSAVWGFYPETTLQPGESVTESFVFRADDANYPPLIKSLVPDTTETNPMAVLPGEQLSVSGTAVDIDDASFELFYSLDGGNPVSMGSYPNPNKATDVPFSGNVMLPADLSEGNHKLVFNVIDERGGESEEKTMYLKNYPEPVINAVDTTILQGALFDPLVGVTAVDATDGDITNKISVTNNDVNTNIPGVYHVTYSVTNDANKTTTKTIAVEVIKNVSVVTEKYQNRNSNQLEADSSVEIIKTSPTGYSKAVSELPVVEDYVYLGYRLAGDTAETPLRSSEPATIAGPITSDTSITYVYGNDKNENGIEDVDLTEKYVDEAGATIKTDTTQVIDIGSDYAPTSASTIPGYVYLGYKKSGDSVITTSVPTISNVQAQETVTMVYGQDKDGNGIVDATITEKYVDEAGATISPDTAKVVDKGTDYSQSAPIVSKHIYMGYKLDGDTVLKTGNPGISDVQAPHTVTMIYGKDENENGIIDSLEATVTAKYVDEVGTTIKPDDSLIVEINDDYTTPAPTIPGYIYQGYKIDSDSTLSMGSPSLPDITTSQTVTLVYGADGDGNGIIDNQEVIITEKYQDRDGKQIKADKVIKIDKNSAAGYSQAVSTLPVIEDYVYVGYKLAGETPETALHTGDPIIIGGPIAADTDITFVFGQDKDGNGQEDVTITEKYVDEAGTTIKADTSEVVDLGADYTETAATITDYTYLGYTVDGMATLQVGKPRIEAVQATHTITMVYGQDMNNNGKEDVTITEKYLAPTSSLPADTYTIVDKGDTYSKEAPIAVGYDYLGYSVDGSPQQQSNIATIEHVVNDATVSFNYEIESVAPITPTVNPTGRDDGTEATGTKAPKLEQNKGQSSMPKTGDQNRYLGGLLFGLALLMLFAIGRRKNQKDDTI